MPTYYAEDFDGKKADDAVEPVTFNPVGPEEKVVESGDVEDKAVKKATSKSKK